MKYLFLIASVLLFALKGHTQTKPDFFPEDVTTQGGELRCFCKPGVENRSRAKGLELSYGYFGGGQFKAEDTILTQPLTEFRNLSYVKFDIKLPVINKESFKLLLNYSYFSELYDIKRFGADFSEAFRELNDSALKSNSLGVIVSKPLGEFNYLAFRFKLSANGNFGGLGRFFEDRYAIYKFYGIYAIKPSDDFEWGVGLAYSKSFRRNNLIPFLLFNRNFNDKWGIESVFPANAFLRYNLGDGDILLFGVEYDSQSYRVSGPDAGSPSGLFDYAINHSEFLISTRVEHQFARWIWGNFKAGYRFNFSTDFEAKSPGTTPFNVEQSNALFFQVGFFISPPDDLLHRSSSGQ
ncbi:MAG: hypothetical protein KDD19_15930 [Phaeodactylibacter sp.]|nr:hypothetical protein [Phaeodactylibacter sp.]MCB9052280.1 hypothetical protein [Lewinellaceae bacterium]